MTATQEYLDKTGPKKTNKRIEWEKLTEKIILAKSKHQHVGALVYEKVGRFKHWCWFQYEEIAMSPGCLQEVRDKQKELAKE